MRVLVLSAAIGEGHDLPARVIAAELAEVVPDAVVEIRDALALAGGLVERAVLGGAQVQTPLGDRVFDLSYRLASEIGPTSRVAARLATRLVSARVLDAIDAFGADVVVSTYPGATEILGRLRRAGRLDVPVVAAITDLAALRFWASAGVDLHLVTHPESIAEVRAIAGAETEVVPARGMNDPRYAAPRQTDEARRELGLPDEGAIVVVSGGGWAVGDLAGAVEEALGLDACVVVLAGRNDPVGAALRARFDGERVRVLGFSDDVPDLLAAADALVHSTAGLTVLEANVRGCAVVSYGWGRGHIRANNAAFARFGLASVAEDRAELRAALEKAITAPQRRDAGFAALPTAAAVIAERFG